MGEVVKMPDPSERTARQQRIAEQIENFLAIHEAHHVTQSPTVIECHTCNEHLKIQDEKRRAAIGAARMKTARTPFNPAREETSEAAKIRA
jgi:hypothetical protein